MHGNETRFENEVCQDPDVLANYIEGAGTQAAMHLPAHIDQLRNLRPGAVAAPVEP